MFHAFARVFNALNPKNKKLTGEKVRQDLVSYVLGIARKGKSKSPMTPVEQEVWTLWSNATPIYGGSARRGVKVVGLDVIEAEYKDNTSFANKLNKLRKASGPWETYATELLRNKNYWGSAFEMFLLSRQYDVNVRAWQFKDAGTYKTLRDYGPVLPSDVRQVSGVTVPGKRTVDLIYNGINHYDALVPLTTS